MDDDSENLDPLFDLIKDHVEIYPNVDEEPLQVQVSSLDYDDYKGRLGIGRITRGVVKKGQQVQVAKRDGSIENGKIAHVFVNEGLNRKEVDSAYSGDIVVLAGISDISIGETICAVDQVEAMELINIEEPTLSMNFLVNDSPLANQSGKFVTSRHIKARLDRELEVNVGLRVEEFEGGEGFKVSGRGELHLSILLENMRREGYEICVSKPEVLLKKVDGVVNEPVERVIITLPDEFTGTVISTINQRKGILQLMESENGYTKLEYLVPTRGLLGYRSQFINETRGEGILVRSVDSFQPHFGEIPGRSNGVLISQGPGQSMAYSLFNLSERAQMFIGPSETVYEGMIVGLNSRKEDMIVNVCKNKKLTNVRASGSDEALKLLTPKEFTLEEALEFIDNDEMVEITPDAIRLRKKILDEKERKREKKMKNKE
jgi:GTP-binding protein